MGVSGVTGRSRGTKGGKPKAKAKALDDGLKAMFRTLEQRPTPEDLKRAVDQLDGADPPAKAKT